VALTARCDPALDGLPKAREKSRYQSLRAKSPFALATEPSGTPPAQASFAANWFVSGIGRIGGSDFVTIKSRDLSTAFSLFAEESDPKTGVTLASVAWSDAVGKSTVVLRKGNETAHLKFNEAEVRATPAAAAVAGAQAGQRAGQQAGQPLGNAVAGRPPMPGGARPNGPASNAPAGGTAYNSSPGGSSVATAASGQFGQPSGNFSGQQVGQQPAYAGGGVGGSSGAVASGGGAPNGGNPASAANQAPVSVTGNAAPDGDTPVRYGSRMMSQLPPTFVASPAPIPAGSAATGSSR
jgi:hypothetical protein